MRGDLLRLTLVQFGFDRWANQSRVHSSDDLRGNSQNHIPAQ